MCGRFILAQKIERLASRYNVSYDSDLYFEPNYNISPGDFTPIIASNNPNKLQLWRFGLTPFWSKKEMFLFNARAEGNNNKENSDTYTGGKDIINKPSFRKPIREQRCLIPADAFIEGSKSNGLSEPYLIYLRDKVRPFSFAGIWDKWVNPATNEEIFGYSIITTVANNVLKKINHDRSPVILDSKYEKLWLDIKTPLSTITGLLSAYDSTKMNAYRIDSKIKNPKKKSKELIFPLSDPIFKENNSYGISQTLERRGFGRNRTK